MAYKCKTKLANKLLKIYHFLYDSFGPQYWWPGNTPFEIMVGAILTQNTNWHNVERAMANLKRAKLLNPKKLLKNVRRIPQLIKPSGFYILKSKRLINFLEWFVKSYNGDVKNFAGKKTDRIRNELLSLPGIGRETADAMLLYALNRPIFVIDAYTRRIFSRHNIFDHKLTHDEVRIGFENSLPKNPKLYNEYHALIVRLGKEFCRKNEPLCHLCPLNNILG